MKEGRNSGVCQASCPLTLAVPNLCFLCCRLSVWEAHSGGLAGSCSQLWGWPSVGSTLSVQWWRLAWTDLLSAQLVSILRRRAVEPVFPMAQPPLTVRPRSDSEGDVGICPPTPSPAREVVDKSAFLISSLCLPCRR